MTCLIPPIESAGSTTAMERMRLDFQLPQNSGKFRRWHTHTHCGVFTDFSPRSQKTRRDAAVLVYHLLLLFLAKSSQRNLEFMQLLESMLCFLQAIGINLFCGDAFSSLKAVSLLERSTIVAKRCQVKFLQPSTINDHSPYLFLHRFYGVSTTRATLTRH